jgi:hypothetical protein
LRFSAVPAAYCLDESGFHLAGARCRQGAARPSSSLLGVQLPDRTLGASPEIYTMRVQPGPRFGVRRHMIVEAEPDGSDMRQRS